jgi:hypothetical protein
VSISEIIDNGPSKAESAHIRFQPILPFLSTLHNLKGESTAYYSTLRAHVVFFVHRADLLYYAYSNEHVHLLTYSHLHIHRQGILPLRWLRGTLCENQPHTVWLLTQQQADTEKVRTGRARVRKGRVRPAYRVPGLQQRPPR